MAFPANHFTQQGLLIIITLSLDLTVAQIGVNYGRFGDCLLPPSEVVDLYKQYNIQRMRIYDPDQETLEALRGSGIELAVGIPNKDLQDIDACGWVQDNIMSYYPDVDFRHIVVGNEVRPGRLDTQEFTDFVLPAMQNIYNALPDDLRGSIKVTTNVDTGILEVNSSYPPENGRFSPEAAQYLDPIVRFLVDTDAPLFASIYPYFAYKNDPNIKLPYALLDPTFPGDKTPSGTTYKNLFYAIYDAVDAALEKSVDSISFEVNQNGAQPKYQKPKGSESGWPTKSKKVGKSKLASSDAAVDDVASIENARAYVNNLIQAVKNGTPRRPGEPIETYIFAMFDENQKPGDEEERHFGLFRPDGQPKYPVNFD